MNVRPLCSVLLSLTIGTAPLVAAQEPPVAAATPAAAPTPPIDDAALRAAVKALRDDPNLGAEKLERTLMWKNSGERKSGAAAPASPSWWAKFFGWLGELGRVLVWIAGAIAVIFVLFALKRWLDLRGDGAARVALVLPTHVRDLDIRPESLPDDIGAEAWRRWQAARDWAGRRAALSLLYRGALSRLVHQHAVPIKASSTEGECLALARTAFARAGDGASATAARSQYVAQLVDVWVRAVYGQRAPEAAVVQALCAQFAAQLDVAPRAAGALQPRAA